MKRTIIKLTACIALASLLLIYSKQTADGVAQAVQICLNVAVPSLFPMLFLTSYIAQSGIASALGHKAAPLFRRVFRLPGEAASVMIMSMLGGYPAGASMCSALYENGAISRSSAQWLTNVCVCAGPAFLISTVGGMYYNSAKAGLVFLAAQIVSVFAVALICRRPREFKDTSLSPVSTGSDGAFVESALRAARSMMNVCIYIILFAGLTAALDASGLTYAVIALAQKIGIPETAARALLLSAAEVSSGCRIASKAGFGVTGFAVGFGGLSVHFQIFSIAKNIKISRPHFIAVRLIQGFICSAASILFAKLLINDAAVSVAAIKAARAFPDVTGSALLLIMCAMFVLCAPGLNRRSSRP